MNSWDDQKVRDALAKAGRKKVVVSGPWTEVCNNSFALSAMLEGDYEIYMVEDAWSGGTSKAAHDYSMLRMIQARVVGHLAAGDAAHCPPTVRLKTPRLSDASIAPEAVIPQFQATSSLIVETSEAVEALPCR